MTSEEHHLLTQLYKLTYGAKDYFHDKALIDKNHQEEAYEYEREGLVFIRNYDEKIYDSFCIPGKSIELTWKGLWLLFVYNRTKE